MAEEHRDVVFRVADVRRAEASEADASIVLLDEHQCIFRLELTVDKAELLCVRIAEALEDKYGTR